MRGNELMDHVRDEMAAAGDGYVEMLGEMMTVYLQRHPETEIGDGKTLKGAFAHMRSAAQKKQKDRCYAMPPAEAFALLMEYYGIASGAGEYEACMLAVIGQTTPDKPGEIPPAPQKEPEGDPFDIDALLGVD